jgi:murein DD-endopeptidase MepM/ murein hydrolase activator NlpD
LGFRLNDTNSIQLDLSINNAGLDFQQVVDTSSFGAFIKSKLQNLELVGYGGYGENRSFYNRFPLFNKFDSTRNIHLGVDIWTIEQTPIYLPCDGEIFGQGVHEDEGGYGGVIIVRHDRGTDTFYSLYGHLSHDSIGMYDEGEFITQGEVIGLLGNELQNGGWPPHLHFQLIKDLEGLKRDYPGVCTENEADRYLANCPDPKDFI